MIIPVEALILIIGGNGGIQFKPFGPLRVARIKLSDNGKDNEPYQFV